MQTKRAVIVRKGRVHDVIMTGPSYIPPPDGKLVFSDTANIGDVHDGKTFSMHEPAQTQEELYAYARLKLETMSKAGIDFDLADPGDDPKVVRIYTDYITLNDIMSLSWVAEIDQEDVTLVTRDQVLHMSPAAIVRLREAVTRHVAHAHKVAGQLFKHIETRHIAHRREIDAPETATAVKMESWHRHGNR